MVDAAYLGDAPAAQKWGLSERTVQNYRARLAQDSRLALSFHEKRQLVEQDWAAELPAAIRAGAAFIRRAAEQGDPTDPDMVHAVAGGMKLVAEVLFAKRVLDARMRDDVRDSGQPRPDRPALAEVATDGEYTVEGG